MAKCIGITEMTMDRVEKGKQKISNSTIEEIEKLLNNENIKSSIV